MKIEKNKIYCMDCVEGMTELLDPKVIDVIVTSPPYNLGKDYTLYNDDRPRREYLDWIEEVGIACKRVLKDDGSFFLNVGGKPLDNWIPIDVASRIKKHFKLQNVIHWIKSIAISKEDVGDYPNIVGDIAVGHYKPINSPYFLHDCHEYIFHFTKTGRVKLDRLAIGVPYQDKSNIGRWKSATQDRRCRGNTWFISYETIWKRRPHPTVFPIKLPEMCIKLHGIRKDMLVLDPFMGIGSTAIACKKLGVDFIGFEIDPNYVKIANELLSQKTLLELASENIFKRSNRLA